MPTYISLIRFPQKGMETIKEGPKRLEAAKQRFRAAGGELKAFYLVTGQYDAVAISELPNDEAVARVALRHLLRLPLADALGLAGTGMKLDALVLAPIRK